MKPALVAILLLAGCTPGDPPDFVRGELARINFLDHANDGTRRLFVNDLRLDPAGSDSPNGKYGIPPTNPFIDAPDALGEIWALGLRNPHRFSWDAETGVMYI